MAEVSTSEQFRTRSLQAYGLKKKPLKISLCPTQYQCTAASVTSAVRKQQLNTTNSA